ncbi:hypothetical protein PPYR_02724 [Photinus pyralis]|uniref:Uncharacterized protein n=1 Tax=Photinus pyralis TaxID=7054 RepID=A0A5N4A0S3_PHOPY|nr:hypothetical protein PPYR_02724 [Photinus pyralis]
MFLTVSNLYNLLKCRIDPIDIDGKFGYESRVYAFPAPLKFQICHSLTVRDPFFWTILKSKRHLNIPILFKTAQSALQPEDIAEAVAYILGTPPHVQVHELTIMPLGQTV